MLMALAVLAALEAVPQSTVSLTLAGGADRPPVSAAPRSLSDVARELREGRKAVGGFSAAESTLPQSVSSFIPTFDPEPFTAALQPEVVNEPAPVYAPSYVPAFYGGGHRKGPHHRFPAARLAAPGPAPRTPGRPSAPPAFQRGQATVGHLRQR